MSKSKLSTILIFCKSADVQEKLHNEALERYEADCENQELKNAADEAYKHYYDTCKDISEMIVEATAGKITSDIAFTMAFEKRNDIENILQYK